MARATWDAEAVGDDLRDYVVEEFDDLGAVLVVDETGDVKKDTGTVGVQRQYTGTAGRIENTQVLSLDMVDLRRRARARADGLRPVST